MKMRNAAAALACWFSLTGMVHAATDCDPDYAFSAFMQNASDKHLSTEVLTDDKLNAFTKALAKETGRGLEDLPEIDTTLIVTLPDAKDSDMAVVVSFKDGCEQYGGPTTAGFVRAVEEEAFHDAISN